MKLNYKKYSFTVKLETPIIYNSPFSFIIRSILGKELRKLSCIRKNTDCKECAMNKICFYSLFFETIVDKDNNILKGNENIPHPFVIYSLPVEKETDSINFDIILFGDYIKYFPYVFQAIYNAGKAGLFKDRIKYKIEKIISNNNVLYNNKTELVNDINNDTIEFKEDNTIITKEIKIEIKTPIRLKKQGVFLKSFDYNDLIEAIKWRLNILSKTYGNGEIIDNVLISTKNYKNEKFYWKDYKRYSARQEQELFLGGIMGYFSYGKEFTISEYNLIKMGEIIHIGKNTVFGLGKYEVIE